MSELKGFYAILQFSPVPERQEFVNIGVALFVPAIAYARVQFSEGAGRVERLFGRQEKSFLKNVKQAFENRLRNDFAHPDIKLQNLERFAELRANNVRMSKILPVAVDSPDKDLSGLFDELVGERQSRPKLPKIQNELKKRFRAARVDQYLQKPEPVELPQGVIVEAPYAYQNGSFNLIDPVRLGGDPNEALKQASGLAVEGEWLKAYSAKVGPPKKLIVVGDLTGQKPEFIHAVREMMSERNVSFYDMADVGPLVDDIRKHGVTHLSER